MRFRAEGLALTALVVASACATGSNSSPPDTPRSSPDVALAVSTARARSWMASDAALVAIDAPPVLDSGARDDELARELVEATGVVRAPSLDALVARIEFRLVDACACDVPLDVRVLDVPDEANAFSLPSGDVFVTSAMVVMTRHEDELAALLAHEFAHVIAGHGRSFELLERSTSKTSLGVGEVTTLGASGRVSDIALGAVSRRQELEADLLGVRMMARAGYEPDAMVELVERQRGPGDDRRFLLGTAPSDAIGSIRSNLSLERLSRTHPSDARRARMLRKSLVREGLEVAVTQDEPELFSRALLELTPP